MNRFIPLIKQISMNKETSETALCELDSSFDKRISSVEDALCELDSVLNGGETE